MSDVPTVIPESGFPMNVVTALMEGFRTKMPGYEETVVSRALRPADPHQSIGVFPVDWMPREDSFEIGGFGPTMATYTIRIQVLIKHGDEIEGRALYANDTKNLRAILYRDASLRLSLAQLTEVNLDSIERVQRMGVRNQRYLNNEIQGTFLYLATTEFWVETESVPAPV